MAVINSTVSFNVIFGAEQTSAPGPGYVPRPDGLPGAMYQVQKGQQTVPIQVFTHLFFQRFVTTGQVTVINPN
jgi:hypothetical protein